MSESCKCCGKPLKARRAGKYCNKKCMAEHLGSVARSNWYKPSATEVERSEIQGDRIAMFRAEY